MNALSFIRRSWSGQRSWRYSLSAEEDDCINVLAASCGIEHTKALRLYREVKMSAAIASSLSTRTVGAILGSLRKLEAQLESDRWNGASIPEDCWPYLFVGEEYELTPLLHDKTLLLATLRQGMSVAEDDDRRRGGRASDARLERFVVRLAQIFIRFTGGRPTFYVDPDNHVVRGAFSNFVDEALHQFFSDKHFGPGQIRNSIQRICQLEKQCDSDDI